MTTELSAEERAARAAENERLTKQANEMAVNARMADQARGVRPVMTEVADSIRQQLEQKFPKENTPYEEGGTGEGNATGNN